MTRTKIYKIVITIAFSALTLIFAGCRQSNNTVSPPGVSPQATTATTIQAPSTNTPLLPSPTPVPLAARVGKDEITLAEYQAELALYQAATDMDLSTEDKQRVLDDLINQTLLAQAAEEEGFTVDDSLLNEHLRNLTDQLGGEQVLAEWITAHGYSQQTFRLALARSVGAAWMRDQIIASLPESAEQIHAHQILLYDSDQANEVYAQLQAGNDFDNLALTYDPVTGGDLGWFPRGYLPDSQLEATVFGLQPGEYSPVLQTPAGYHIVQVIERDPQRLLDPDALLALQAQAVQKWLDARRSEVNIQILTS